jgi:hypothetical protein
MEFSFSLVFIIPPLFDPNILLSTPPSNAISRAGLTSYTTSGEIQSSCLSFINRMVAATVIRNYITLINVLRI